MEPLVDALSWVLLIAGSGFAIVSGLGVVRLPDLYTRMHGASIADTMVAGLILGGLILQAGFSLIAVKLLLILVFLVFTSPASAHALGNAAIRSGLDPLLADPPPDQAPGQAPGQTGGQKKEPKP